MRKRKYETGSRNVFKDLGVPNADEHMVKAQLVFKIDIILKQRKLKQVEAAALFGVRQPDISTMLRGVFQITEAQGETKIQPNAVTNDLGREAMTMVKRS